MNNKHAVLSPSKAVRWLACPGSVTLEPAQDRTSRPAAEGTMAHEIAAECITGGVGVQHWLGETYEVRGFKFVITQDIVDGIQQYVDAAREAILAAPCQHFVEVAVPIGHLTGEEGATGTADLVILRERELEVRDLKFGMGVEVDPEDNPQLAMYALGTLEWLSAVVDESCLDTVRLVIHQPRLAGPKEAVYTMAELKSWVPKLAAGAAEVQRAKEVHAVHGLPGLVQEGSLRPTNDGCKFCPAKATCPALRAEILAAVEADFEDLTAAPEDTLAGDLARVERVESWCKAVRGEVERRLCQNIPVPGYKLVAGRRGPRRWIDEAEAIRVLEAQLGPDAWEKSLISPTKAGKMVDGALFSSLVTQTDGKPSVAFESDKRPAVTVAATADDFDVVDPEGI